MNAVAWRLPSVIVPVLSSSSTSTSPAASTARPDIAMTFAWIMRSMPAMPIADSSAADRGRDQADEQRHQHGDRDRRALAGRARRCRARTAAASRVASRKMIVSAASRMSSAISFGVFCRLAPSTSAIIRSRKVSPGLAVTSTTIQSDRTCVPPVTRAAVAAGLADHRRALAGDRAPR